MTWTEVIEAHLRDEQIYLAASKKRREADEKELAEQRQEE